MARIGPHAVLHLVAVMDRALGRARSARILVQAGIEALPDPKAGLMDEDTAAALHRGLRAELPDLAPALAREAGRCTADYILAHRIPAPAQWLLRRLSPHLAAPLLARAVARNAWTFCGSGSFRLVSGWPVIFEIADNPLVRGEKAKQPLCAWHCAVFARLLDALCCDGWTCIETACCAQGAPACRFECRRGGTAPLRPPAGTFAGR